MIDPLATTAVAWALALLLGIAAWSKVQAPQAFHQVLAGYQLLPPPLVTPVARVLTLAEFAVAGGLLFGAPLAFFLASCLFVTYAIAMAINLARGRVWIDCGCSFAADAISWWLVARNGALATVALVGLAPTTRSLAWFDYLLLVPAVLTAALLYAGLLQLAANAAPRGEIAHG
mgnify:CR=1 FL=1